MELINNGYSNISTYIGNDIKYNNTNTNNNTNDLNINKQNIKKKNLVITINNKKTKKPIIKDHVMELPSSLKKFRYSVDKIEKKLRDKIQERTMVKGNFVYQQAFRLLECEPGAGIDFNSFKRQLNSKFGLVVTDDELKGLFNKYDTDGNGTIDMKEFIHHVMPPDYDYSGKQWFENSHLRIIEKKKKLDNEARIDYLSSRFDQNYDKYLIKRDNNNNNNIILNNMGETKTWSIDKLQKEIQNKVLQRTPRGADQYRVAYKMFQNGRDKGITMIDLRENLKNKFGILITENQMINLFSKYDIDNSGCIDLSEFLKFIGEPDYKMDSSIPNGLWTEYDDEDDNINVSQENDMKHINNNANNYTNKRPVSPNPLITSSKNIQISSSKRPQSARPAVFRQSLHINDKNKISPHPPSFTSSNKDETINNNNKQTENISKSNAIPKRPLSARDRQYYSKYKDTNSNYNSENTNKVINRPKTGHSELSYQSNNDKDTANQDNESLQSEYTDLELFLQELNMKESFNKMLKKTNEANSNHLYNNNNNNTNERKIRAINYLSKTLDNKGYQYRTNFRTRKKAFFLLMKSKAEEYNRQQAHIRNYERRKKIQLAKHQSIHNTQNSITTSDNNNETEEEVREAHEIELNNNSNNNNNTNTNYNKNYNKSVQLASYANRSNNKNGMAAVGIPYQRCVVDTITGKYKKNNKKPMIHPNFPNSYPIPRVANIHAKQFRPYPDNLNKNQGKKKKKLIINPQSFVFSFTNR